MEYTTPEQTPGVKQPWFKSRTLFFLVIAIIAVAVALVVFYGLFRDARTSQSFSAGDAPVTATTEVRSLSGRITEVTSIGFTIQPLGDTTQESRSVLLSPTTETTYEKRATLKSETDYQAEIADYQAKINAATQGDTAALEYIRTTPRPDPYTYQPIDLLRDFRISVGDFVTVTTEVPLTGDETEIVPLIMRFETVNTFPETEVQYTDERAPISSVLIENPLVKYTVMDHLRDFFGVAVAEAAVCPYSPGNGGGFSGGPHREYTWDFGAGQYMTGFHIRTNCDFYSSEDGCVDVRTDALGGSDMFYQSNGGSWTGYQAYNTVDLGPGQYISGIAYRTNCDYYSTEDGCLNVKVSTAAPGTSAYRTNAGSWTGFTYAGYVSDEVFQLSPGQYISGIDYRSNCDFVSSENDCIRFKISDFTTDDALCGPPPNTLPRGNNDGVAGDCTAAFGWGQDQDGGNPIAIHFYMNGTYATGVFAGAATANLYRADLCAAIGSCNHGYSFPIPPAYQTGSHSITAYAIDSTGGANPTLGTVNYSCAAPVPPVCAANAGLSCNSSANSCGMTGTGVWDCAGTTCSASTPPDASCPIPGSDYMTVRNSPTGPDSNTQSITLGERVWFNYSCTNTSYGQLNIMNWRTKSNSSDWTDSPGITGPATAVGRYRPRLPGTQQYYLRCYSIYGLVEPPAAVVSVNIANPPKPTLEMQVNSGAWGTANQTVSTGDTVRVRWDSNYDFYQNFSLGSRPANCTGNGFSSGGATSSAGIAVTLPPAGSSVNLSLDCREIGVIAPGYTWGVTYQDSSNVISLTTNAIPPPAPANLTQPSVSHTIGTFNVLTNTYDTVTVRLQTSNNGGVSTSPVNPQYRMRFDQGADGSYESTQSGAIGVLNAGQTSATLSQTFTNISFGPNQVEVTADEPNSVTESNESDNTRMYDFGGMLLPPDPGLSIIADRMQVRQGDRVWITWDTTLTYPMDCRIVGPGTIVDPSGLSGTHQTDGINAKSEFTFTCTEPITGATFSDSVIVETVGQIEEV